MMIFGLVTLIVLAVEFCMWALHTAMLLLMFTLQAIAWGIRKLTDE